MSKRNPIATTQLDKAIEKLYYTHAQGKHINILDIGKVYTMAYEAMAAGGSLEEGVKAGIAKYCTEAS
jgi:hypothetical protein